MKASYDMAVEPGMAEGLKILARMIATAHRRRAAETGGILGSGPSCDKQGGASRKGSGLKTRTARKAFSAKTAKDLSSPG